MSELSYLEKLLDGVEVEWLPLSGLARIRNGKDHKSLSEGEFPVYGSGGIMRYVDTYAYNKPSVLIPRKGSLGNLFFVNVPFWTVDTIFYTEIDEAQIRPKYLYYFLTTVGLGEMNQAGGVPSQTQSVLNKLKIPIPCPDNPEKSLAIQSEIVRILDKFTELTAELTAELSMRKKQYNYYRDQLLSFDTEDVPHLPMGQKDIGEFIRGGTFQKKDFMDAGVGCIHYGQIYTYYGTYTKKTKTYISAALAKKCKKAQKGNLIIATTSENDEDVCKAVAWLGSEDIAVSSDACIYKHNLNPKYVSYYFQTEQFQNQKRQYITGAKVRRVNADNLSKILIPVPSMEVQERIVSILDKFDTLTYSITEGLPREIELRQKQYEYYRDLLFSFPKPETVSN
ncbi:TPA: restriction endonuclease subunit S [Escherichia coli]|uniref:restriction endonuclease subunit S n=1 Tax=Escherichia TaxID=561 RepID=UPI001330D1F2|nr:MULTISPECIES: restriction endonuclease subunit S [Escherichia]EJT9098415.1 restriction endonuclease subunit S [Escherichia coli]EKE7418995.1 restriction endonuclease subunit S [Escherichia coli]ELV1715132.1 restriction endonuclease subunit S [Escherichia coli]MBY8720165.1 restriction endonuclease subunit S [Escherichia coli]MDU9577071.1 restriction endonuclease subunit S [Escherichia coli]